MMLKEPLGLQRGTPLFYCCFSDVHGLLDPNEWRRTETWGRWTSFVILWKAEVEQLEENPRVLKISWWERKMCILYELAKRISVNVEHLG